MGNNQQNQQQEQYFQPVRDQISQHLARFNKVKQIANPSLFEKDLQQNIKEEIDTLIKYLDNAKIYIVFMGTTSSGKSTFLNALLGQKLLPSRNQDCTNQISYIEHCNINVNGKTQISINKKKFFSSETALKELNTIRDSPNMKNIKIQTQSYFHTTLSKDLQNRVIFIDTPGIKITDCSDEQYAEHFGKINQQIKLDKYSKRINVWVSDYTTFDRDKKIQKKIISSLISKVEQNQQSQQNQDNKQIQQSNDESSRPFFILNKFDQRKKTEDRSIDYIQNDINNVFDSEDIFKISASNALNYNIMNYGTKDAKENFITQFYEDNGENMKLTNQNKARNYCENNIKNNQNLIKNQDFNGFMQKMTLQIKQVLDKFFNHLFNDLNQMIQYLELGEEFKKAKQQLTQEQKEKISQFWSDFDKQSLRDYKKELQNEKDIYIGSIQQLIIDAKNKIEKQDSKSEIESEKEAISIITIARLDELNKNFLKITQQSKDELFNKIKQILQQQQQTSTIIERCIIIFQLMEECIQKQKKQFVQKQADELSSKLGIKVNSFFYEKASELDNNKKVTFSSIVGGEYQRGRILQALITVEGGLVGLVTGTVVTAEAASLAVTASILGASVFAGVTIGSIFGYYGYKKIKQKFWKNKLEVWNESLNSQSQDLVRNYIKIYDDTLVEIKRLIE